MHVLIKIFDPVGEELTTLVDEEKPAGRYDVRWNARGFGKRRVLLAAAGPDEVGAGRGVCGDEETCFAQHCKSCCDGNGAED